MEDRLTDLTGIQISVFAIYAQNMHLILLSCQIQEEVAKELGIPVQYQRFWLWAKRQNHTYRPNRPLTPQEEAQSVCGFCFICLLFALSTWLSVSLLKKLTYILGLKLKRSPLIVVIYFNIDGSLD